MKLPQLPQRLFAALPRPLSVLPGLPFVAGLETARRFGWLVPPPELHDRRFALYVADLGLRLRFRCTAQGFRPLAEGEADLELGASSADFFALLRGAADADTLFFQRRLAIRGDTELGLVVKNWLDACERPAWLQRLAPQD
ncbi:MAG TPA: SCP2 sterol-binding domain-containing protein [Rhodocyclaceae bacterium]